MPVKYSVVKDLDCFSTRLNSRATSRCCCLVGLGGIEPPTSPLSGVRSSHLSYRPGRNTGGAGRDRTGDLLNANQALSQLSYSPWIFRSERGGPKTGPLRTIDVIEASWMQRPKVQPSAASEKLVVLPVEIRSVLLARAEAPTRVVEWNGYFLLARRGTLSRSRLSETPPTFSLRKEVIQPQVLLRLPCYDFTPIMDHTLGRCPPCGSACRLLVQSTFVM